MILNNKQYQAWIKKIGHCTQTNINNKFGAITIPTENANFRKLIAFGHLTDDKKDCNWLWIHKDHKP